MIPYSLRNRGMEKATAILLLWTACASASNAGAAEGSSEPTTFLALATSQGEIVIELHADAAPAAVHRILGLVQANDRDSETNSSFEGLVFDHARPHIEIRVARRESGSEILLDNEIDARALGLHERRIENPAAAMEVLQRELLPSRSKGKRGEQLQPRLREWIDIWHESYESGFLVGISRMQVLEALGHRFTAGLASRPVRRGAVTLVPVTTGVCTPQLNLHLIDQPEKDGIWMVVGTIVRGLTLADSISTRPLGRDKASQYRPIEPVRIDRARIVDEAYPALRESDERQIAQDQGGS